MIFVKQYHMLQILKDMVQGTGRVYEVFGGYEIVIDIVEEFPWHKICVLLLESQYEVWMVKSNSNLIIMSKPALD